MVYAAVALAVLGFAVGVVFRLKVLLPILALLLVFSIVFAVTHGYDFVDAALTVMAVQFIVQTGYFAGMMVRAVFGATHRTGPIL